MCLFSCGQRALYGVGITGIPIYNVNNNCSTGSSALFMAKQFIQGGIAECVLALGFEKMEKGSLGQKFPDRTNPMDQHMGVMSETHGISPKAPFAPQMFGNAGREHMKLYGTTATHFAKIAEKNHRHSANNPYSQFRTARLQHIRAALRRSLCLWHLQPIEREAHACLTVRVSLQVYTLDEILKSPMVHEPLTKLQWSVRSTAIALL